MSKKFAYFFIYLVIFFFGPFMTQAEAESLELFPPIDQQKEYPLSAAGMKELLFDLYQFGTEEHYMIQFDGALDLSQTAVGNNESLSNPTIETINFASLPASLTFKGAGADSHLSLPKTCFFGQDSHFETLNLKASKIYGNGHQLYFENIQHSDHTQLFGGSDGNLVGNPILVFQGVTGGSWEIYGGNEAGTLTGSPSIQLLSLTGDIQRLCGGSLKGEIIGNVSTRVQQLNGMLMNYYGGGFGTADEPVNVKGTIDNQLTSESTAFTLGDFVGGAAFGETGAVNTLITGKGSFSDTGILIGGSQVGEIHGQEQAITTVIDTRQFQKGERNFVGGNQYSGTIYGDIENQIYAGKASQGSFNRIDGAGGMDLEKRSLTNSQSLTPVVDLTDPQKRTAEELAYDQLAPLERFSLAKSNTRFFVEGNVVTRLLGGCVSGGRNVENNVCGAGVAGVINGDVQLELGQETLVYSKRWGVYAQEMGLEPTKLTNERNLGASYGFSTSAGGGENQQPWGNTLYINGKTELVIKQALLNYAYGGSFNGIIEGTCSSRLEKGQVSAIFGAGSGCYRIYGNSRLEITGGKVENYAVAGSNQDRRLIGDIQTRISGGEILGSVAASYGLRSNHMIEGNVETIISGGKFSKSNEATQIMGGIAKHGLLNGNVALTITGAVELAAGLGISAARPRMAEITNRLGGIDKQLAFELTTEQSFAEVEVLGDGGENPTSVYTPAINMKMRAPNGRFSLVQGMLKNSYAGSLTHELSIEIQAAQSVQTIIGSDSTTFNNRLIENSPAKVGVKIGGTQADIPVEKIQNFTQLTLENNVSAKRILNGSGATNENFGQTFDQFGELSLIANARLNVEELKTGRLMTAKNTELHSPAGENNIFLRELLPEEKLRWRLLIPETLHEVTGRNFAQQKGYPIMTFVGENSSLGPENFIGFDEQGQAFTGDSNGQIGLAVSATIIDYQVASESGEITHNLTLKPNNQPLPLNVWGVANKRSGELIIPSESTVSPELRFTDTEQFSLQQAEVIGSSGENILLTENYWRPLERTYYQIRAHFHYIGSLKLLAVPDLIDFGQHKLGKQTAFYPTILGHLEIKDTRIEQSPWKLTLQAEAPEGGQLYFQEDGKLLSLEEPVTVLQQTGSLNTTFEEWDESKGLFLTIPKEQQKLGEESMTFHWTLTTNVE
ncbi:hypothetical protein [Enterococcus sp. DIV0170]|uniref:hypothetical protein n=1 Tax=Enterococcus sp. DIV0170 TaxID=2774642 RepID=UPI003F28DEB7